MEIEIKNTGRKFLPVHYERKEGDGEFKIHRPRGLEDAVYINEHHTLYCTADILEVARQVWSQMGGAEGSHRTYLASHENYPALAKQLLDFWELKTNTRPPIDIDNCADVNVINHGWRYQCYAFCFRRKDSLHFIDLSFVEHKPKKMNKDDLAWMRENDWHKQAGVKE